MSKGSEATSSRSGNGPHVLTQVLRRCTKWAFLPKGWVDLAVSHSRKRGKSCHLIPTAGACYGHVSFSCLDPIARCLWAWLGRWARGPLVIRRATQAEPPLSQNQSWPNTPDSRDKKSDCAIFSVSRPEASPVFAFYILENVFHAFWILPHQVLFAG